jgi:hypothetical protein
MHSTALEDVHKHYHLLYIHCNTLLSRDALIFHSVILVRYGRKSSRSETGVHGDLHIHGREHYDKRESIIAALQ